jgi:hypothetical protein
MPKSKSHQRKSHRQSQRGGNASPLNFSEFGVGPTPVLVSSPVVAATTAPTLHIASTPSVAPLIKGGSGAAEYAQSVYGNALQQHAVSATNHEIAVNPAIQSLSTKQMGGKRSRSSKMIIPTVFLYTNTIGMKMSKSRKHRKRHGKSNKTRKVKSKK